MDLTLPSDRVHERVDALLLAGEARSAFEAEEMFLDAHLPELVRLSLELDDKTFMRHEAVKLLVAHGSRAWEDALK